MKHLALSLIYLLATQALIAQINHHVTTIGEFNRLTVTDNVNVEYRCNPDSAGIAIIDGSDEFANSIILNLSTKGHLNIQATTDALLLGENLPTVIVYSSSLTAAENAGDSTLRITGLPEMEQFKLRLSDNGKIIASDLRASQLDLSIVTGNGQIIASGQCDRLQLKLIGTGQINTASILATDVSCRIVGTGSIYCQVADQGELTVRGSGTGKVFYHGTPSKLSVRKLGTIKVIPIE